MGKDKDFYESMYGCVPIGACMVAMIVCFIQLFFCSCKPTKEMQVERVEVPVIVTQEHTIERTKIDQVRDTLIQIDSVYYYVKGDTVLIERWHYMQGRTNIVRVDTLIKTDSIQVPVEVVKTQTTTKIEKVEKPLKWYQKGLMIFGGLCLIMIAFWIVYISRRTVK